MSERPDGMTTEDALVALTQAVMQGEDVLEEAQRLGLNAEDRAHLYDCFTHVLRVAFDSFASALGGDPHRVAQNIALLVASTPARQTESPRAPLRLWN